MTTTTRPIEPNENTNENKNKTEKIAKNIIVPKTYVSEFEQKTKKNQTENRPIWN